MSMSKRERERLLKLYALMGKIPFPHMGGGTQSATVIGYVNYANDMRAVYGYFQHAVLAIAAGKDWDGITPADADTLLCALERWVEIRTAQQWGSVSMDAMPYMPSLLDDVSKGGAS